MLPDRVSNPGPLTYESGALPIALRGPAQYYIIFTNQLFINPKFISNIINIIEKKIHKFNTLHLKCFPGFMQQLVNLVFVEFPRFL